jgi:hypothetical protein
MPSRHTFDVKPIGDFVRRYLEKATVSVDPFCGNKRWATHNNDLAHGGADAEEFLKRLAAEGVRADLAIFDPPYSPRQISECYKSVGMEVGMKETQNAALYARVKRAMVPILDDKCTVLSFGWNSVGMGGLRGFRLIELMMVCHGGAHNDTICLAERRLP